jgi:hypothetical protein
LCLPVAAVLTVAGCTSGSGGDTTPSATVTDTVTSAAPPTGSGVPASTPASTPASSGGASSGSTGSSSSGGNASGPGLCTPTVMTFEVGQSDGAAGTSYVPIIATNASQQPCVTTGYPGVAALDQSGAQIAQAGRTMGGTGGTTIVVQPGQQVSSLLAAASMASGIPTCPTSTAILFTLPDNTDSTKLDLRLPACADGISVDPLVRGTTGR